MICLRHHWNWNTNPKHTHKYHLVITVPADVLEADGARPSAGTLRYGGINFDSQSCNCHALQWRHNGRDSVSDHQPRECLLSRLIKRRSKKTSKLCITGLCVANSQETGEFSAQRASNAESVSIWWCHDGQSVMQLPCLCSCHGVSSLVQNQIWWPKSWLPTLVTFGHRLPKLVANISSDFHHLVNTGLTVGSLVKWLPIKVANPSKIDKFECSPIGNGSIRLWSSLTHYALWNFTSNVVGQFSELVGAHTLSN